MANNERFAGCHPTLPSRWPRPTLQGTWVQSVLLWGSGKVHLFKHNQKKRLRGITRNNERPIDTVERERWFYMIVPCAAYVLLYFPYLHMSILWPAYHVIAWFAYKEKVCLGDTRKAVLWLSVLYLQPPEMLKSLLSEPIYVHSNSKVPLWYILTFESFDVTNSYLMGHWDVIANDLF